MVRIVRLIEVSRACCGLKLKAVRRWLARLRVNWITAERRCLSACTETSLFKHFYTFMAASSGKSISKE